MTGSIIFQKDIAFILNHPSKEFEVWIEFDFDTDCGANDITKITRNGRDITKYFPGKLIREISDRLDIIMYELVNDYLCEERSL